MTIIVSVIRSGAVLKYTARGAWHIEIMESVGDASARVREIAPVGASVTVREICAGGEWKREGVML
jgi:hypothetical protein